MSMYITGKTIKRSVGLLKNTDVNGSAFFCYLILRRHMVLKSFPSELDISGSEIKEASYEAARIDISGNKRAFNPLQSKYLLLRWCNSNGPSVTIPGWNGRTKVIERLPNDTIGDKGVCISVSPFDADDIKTLLKLKDAGRPDIIDLAIWWYRDRDLENLLDASSVLTAGTLKNQFTQDLGLKDSEVSVLFADPSAYADSYAIEISDTIADASSYLPPLQPSAPKASTYQLKNYEAGSCKQLIEAVNASGFIFAPEQVATYLTAVRTKPFVILAGVSGTGKTHLPITLAKSTGSDYTICSVRPDWTDSSPLLGYTDIQGQFHPGVLLEYAKKAMEDASREYFFLLDEMNLARVEYYLSDVLSKMETMYVDSQSGKLQSEPLMPEIKDNDYKNIVLPSNLCFVGSINMDESTQPISKKVLDRAFVLDFNEVDLSVIREPIPIQTQTLQWSSDEWGADRKPLFGTVGLDADEFESVTSKLTELNKIMKLGGFNFGYRLRNEICAFIANAKNIDSVFSDEDASSSPLDIALKTKALSRIEGQGIVVNDVIKSIRDYLTTNEDGDTVADSKTKFQRTLNKLSDMADMFDRTGYASYWN